MEASSHRSKKWLVVGSAGMLGQDMVRVLELSGHDVSGVTRSELDVTDPSSAEAGVAGFDVVVNCAAWTAVDDAEAREGEAFAINAVGAANLAKASARTGARLVQISTDYVFAGSATVPYGEDQAVAPRSAYGRTKAAGEWAVLAASAGHLVVRTAWLYGAGGPCFPRTMARLARERDELSVVADQVGQPTWTVDVADLVLRLVDSDAPGGVYHGTSAGETSWFDFTRAIVESIGASVSVVPTTSEAFVRPAPRPAYSVLSHGALEAVGVAAIGDWSERWQRASAEVLGA
ncbi:NAD(P)-dependent oxidoreductase [Oerskovia sp. Root918]|uniref:dTDP-4-dehydrorhamnose reductase n=1 Tax=Oerskovia sp. Root918 TaxID=1736607 RepID=UPI0007014CAF|nr:dTDP-4-dehydrorhamnose reductase [Oerskovia sp. Root918]KRD47481.1 NAD(P)-dependent oxidoreductase [Oerskovia sp. Root918]